MTVHCQAASCVNVNRKVLLLPHGLGRELGEDAIGPDFWERPIAKDYFCFTNKFEQLIYCLTPAALGDKCVLCAFRPKAYLSPHALG